jgi:hypothetical protein
MSASEFDIARLRRMTKEPTEDTYDDETMAIYLEAWPLIDDEGRDFNHDEWTEAYDLHAAAADLWEEKAATVHAKHDFSADGASYSSNQMYENCMDQARFHRARQKAATKRVHKSPVEPASTLYLGYIANVDMPGEDNPFSLWDDNIENIP